MSLNCGISYIFFLICCSFVEPKILNSIQELENNLNGNGIDSNNESSGQERINLSMPGTKWCGPGNTASDYDDLGKHREVDMCCRDHDFCDNIPAGESKYNLTNRDFFTVLDCDCDHQFHQCLRKINSKESNRIGRMYFTLRNHCYHAESPILSCDEYDTEMFLRRCTHYKLDETQPKRYQWFDLPLYYDRNERDALNDEVYEY